MDKNTEILQKILDKLDAIDSSVVGMQNDLGTIMDIQVKKSQDDAS